MWGWWVRLSNSWTRRRSQACLRGISSFPRQIVPEEIFPVAKDRTIKIGQYPLKNLQQKVWVETNNRWHGTKNVVWFLRMFLGCLSALFCQFSGQIWSIEDATLAPVLVAAGAAQTICLQRAGRAMSTGLQEKRSEPDKPEAFLRLTLAIDKHQIFANRVDRGIYASKIFFKLGLAMRLKLLPLTFLVSESDPTLSDQQFWDV